MIGRDNITRRSQGPLAGCATATAKTLGAVAAQAVLAGVLPAAAPAPRLRPTSPCAAGSASRVARSVESVLDNAWTRSISRWPCSAFVQLAGMIGDDR